MNPKGGHGVTLLNGLLGSIFVLLFMRKNEKRRTSNIIKMNRITEPFVIKMCEKFNIDESHGLKHSVRVSEIAHQLMKSIPDITEEQRHMAMMSAALHDLCDHKYVDEEIGASLIKDWLCQNQLWKEDVADSLISIITTMSYSKLKKEVDLSGNPVFPDHGKWQISYEVARHADLLESYVVARCVTYNKHIHPDWEEDAHWEKARELFEERVFTYVKNGWITLPGALALVPSLEVEARRCLDEHSMDW